MTLKGQIIQYFQSLMAPTAIWYNNKKALHLQGIL